MRFRARALAVGVCATLLMTACTPPAAQQEAPPEPSSEVAPEAGAAFSDGVVRVSMNGGEAAEMPASECVIVNDGANGVVRAGDGDFELNWANGTFRVVWNSGSGLYNGDVNGAVDRRTITFDGANGGATVSGSATCD